MRKAPVRWQATHTFNPAAVVKDGKVYVLYRAEDDSGSGIGGYTSRLGLAVSDDGTRFDRLPTPVLYPAEDEQKEREWESGCEDPRVSELEDGSYVLFYTRSRRCFCTGVEQPFGRWRGLLATAPGTGFRAAKAPGFCACGGRRQAGNSACGSASCHLQKSKVEAL